VTPCRCVGCVGICREGQCVRNEKLRDPRKKNNSFPQRTAVNTHVSKEDIILTGRGNILGELNVLEVPYMSEKLVNTSARKAEKS
jgi:hypothetical protein